MSRRIIAQKIWLASTLVGLALFVYLVGRTGPATILANIRLLGEGFLVLLLLSGLRQCFRAVAWYACIESGERRIGLLPLFGIRLTAEAVTDLTPAGPFLGETARFLAASQRMPAAESLSSIVIENLTYNLAVGLFILSGIIVVLVKFALPPQIRMATVGVALALLLPVVLPYVMISRRWMALGKLLDRLKAKNLSWGFLARHEEKIRVFEETVHNFHRKHRSLFFYIVLLEAATNFTGVAEAFLILKVTTQHSSLLAAYLVESVNRVVNAVFAFVPLRVGVEEGGAALILKALGYTVTDGVSLAIIRKVRTLFWVGVGLLLMTRHALPSKAEIQS